LVPKFVIWVKEPEAAWDAAGRLTPIAAPTARTMPSRRDFRNADLSMGRTFSLGAIVNVLTDP
jgi:hypothetical protein